MIVLVLLLFVAGGVPSPGSGREPVPPGDRAMTDGCASPGFSLLMERDGALLAVDPHTHTFRELPIHPEVGRIVAQGQALLTRIVPGPWYVEWGSDDEAHRIVVTDRRTGVRVVDVSFDRRIELSTAVSSPSGRYTVHVQGNNVASEVTILDARAGTGQRVRIPHDARLAAFAIGVAIGPDETCAAISMERAGGQGAETWLLDLTSGEVQVLPVPGAFVLGWVRGQV